MRNDETTTHSSNRRKPLWLALSLAFAANIIALLLFAMDAAWEGDEELFQFLIAFDQLGIATALLFGFGKLRSEAMKADGLNAELASLSRAKLSAESANRAKSRYLATISHEIRSPLNAIYGYAQLVEADDGVSPAEAAKVIRRCAEHLTSLVEGLLDISQLEFGVLRVRNEEVRFRAFIEQILWMMRPAATAKGLKFVYIPPARMPEFVRLDPSRLRQILINLLSNAIKFTQSGSVTLQIGYSGQIATFEVRDTGPGIAPENRERVFEPFEQIGDLAGDTSGSQRDRSGAGLGLAIARAITEILGGKLELDSEVGVGTCFRVSLMMSEVSGKILPQVAASKVTGYEGRPRSILLVEDDADQRLFIEHLLRSLGFDVLACPSGEAALARDAAQPVDLAILDITLPGISGWETAMGLRERFGTDIQILMLSANSDELHRPDFGTPMHDLFLVKPVEFEALVEAVGGLLNLNWRRDVSTAPSAHQVPDADVQHQPGPAFSVSAQAHVDRLKEYLRIGYVRGIEAEIQELEKSSPEAAALAGRLYHHLDRYDLVGMAKLLQEG